MMNLQHEVVPMNQSKRRRIDGNDGASSAAREGLIELEVLSISGECMVTLNVADSMLGRELWKMILDKIPSKPGLQLVVSHTSRLVLHESLQQQGLGGQRAQVSATYMPVNLHAAWLFAHGSKVEDKEFSLNGITQLTGVDDELPAFLSYLPKSLRTLTFAPGFNQDLHHVRLPPRPSKCDFWRPVQSEPGQCDMASRPSKLMFWSEFQSKPWQSAMASSPAKCDFWFQLQSEPGQRDMASRPSKFMFWSQFQSKPWWSVMASRPAKCDFWLELQSERGQCFMASRPSKFDFWAKVQSEPGQCVMASRPSKFDIGRWFQSELGHCVMASRPAKFDCWSTFQSEPGQYVMASRPSKFDI